jgi:tRNA(His) 5'-end guanylyltransferase
LIYIFQPILILIQMTDSTTTELKCNDISPSLQVYTLLKEAQYPNDPLLPVTYEYSPFISKEFWTRLGDSIVEREKNVGQAATGEQFVVLRLDGQHFGTTIQQLRHHRLFPAQGYCSLLGTIMQRCTQELIRVAGAIVGFTQSDEITIIIPCTSLNRKTNLYHPHTFGGRIKKWETYSSSLVAQSFMKYIAALWYKQEVELKLTQIKTGTQPLNILQEMSDFNINFTFDCRASIYDTLSDAFATILWRAYDCNINGISSGVFFSQPNDSTRTPRLIKQQMLENTMQKIKWFKSRDFITI